MALTLPGAEQRWRCAHCGNLTRFDVERRRRTREYWHVGLDGQPVVEDVEVLGEDIDAVRCRWCGSADAVVLVPRPEGDTAEGPGGTP
jgi:hypothetical protein